MKDKVKVLHIMGENFASNQKPLPGVLEAFGGRMQTKGIDSMIRCCVPIKESNAGRVFPHKEPATVYCRVLPAGLLPVFRSSFQSPHVLVN